MPIYGYECRSCGHTLDALQKVSDAPLVDCPSCGEPDLKRQLSAPRFRLKGGGWYETDFKSDNKRNLADGDKPADKPAEKKADSTPASTSDSSAGGSSTGKKSSDSATA